MPITTTHNFFPVEDITHKPLRYQGDSLRPSTESNLSEQSSTLSRVPQNVTIEKAISFYEENAHGEYRNLYLSTAKWLKESLSAKSRRSEKEEVLEIEVGV